MLKRRPRVSSNELARELNIAQNSTPQRRSARGTDSRVPLCPRAKEVGTIGVVPRARVPEKRS
jgi:hypothetical protein